MRRYVALAVLTVAVGLAALAVLRRPHRAAPVDAAHAFDWDLATFRYTRGGCSPIDDDAWEMDWKRGWTPQPGRYVLTLGALGPRHARTETRGKLWLSEVAPPRGDTILFGAADIDASTLIDSAAARRTRAAAASPDVRRPGVLLARDTIARRVSLVVSKQDGSFVELVVRQGAGDGFAGSWRFVGADGRAARGYFCAGWIDV